MKQKIEGGGKAVNTIILEELAIDWKFNEREGGDVEMADKITRRVKKLLLRETDKLGLSEDFLIKYLINHL